MKKIYSMLALIFLLPLAGISEINHSGTLSGAPKPGKIQVYYFHYERRCATCIAVEDETKKALNELYAAQVKKGDITFKSINLEEKSGEALANKLKVAGQSLVIVKDDKVTSDLTDKAFMYARSEPAKLKAEIRQQIDAQLKK